MKNLDIYPLYKPLKTKCRILYSRAIRYISQPLMFDFQFNQCLMFICLSQLSSFAILGLYPFGKSYIMVICSLLIKQMQLVGISSTIKHFHSLQASCQRTGATNLTHFNPCIVRNTIITNRKQCSWQPSYNAFLNSKL